jgi:outer membrane cobalamin receptor
MFAPFLASVVSAQQPPNPATAQAPAQLETVIVTATYEPAPLLESDRTVDVIDLGRSTTVFPTWAEALRLDSSIDLEQRAPGTQADLSIRGSTFGQTLVLVDGIRINDAQSAHHNMDLPLPFAAIERIEVLHGSGSTLYGSDAVGGAVNFITAPPLATEVKLRAAGGTYHSQSESGSAGLVARGWSEQLAVTRDASSGFMPDRDYSNFATSSETRLDTALGLTHLLLALSDRPFGADQFYGDFNSWERTKGWFAGATQDLGKNTQLVFGFRRHTDEFILLRDHPEIYENNHITDSWEGAVRERKRFSENNRLYYGGEFFSDSIASNNLGIHQRSRGAAYVNFDARAMGRLSLSAGAREEIFSQGHAVLSPNAAAGYGINSHLRLKASIAHAFRLPTYTDLYYSDPANIGNPNLRPETAWGYEGGIEWSASRGVAGSVTVFHRRAHDVIDYVRSGASSIYQAVNIEDLDFTGAEVLVRSNLKSQQLDLAYTALYGAQRPLAGLESRYVFNYPINQAAIGWLGALPHRFHAHARIGVTERYSAEAYPLMEVSASRDFGHVEPYLEVTNLTNTGFEEIAGVRMPGRAYLAGVEVRFSRQARVLSK